MKISLILFTMMWHLQSMAAKETHGGGAIVCRDSQKKILSAEKLDFFVGRKPNNFPGGLGLTINPPFPGNSSQNQNILQNRYEKHAMDRLRVINPMFYKVIAEARQHIARRFYPVPPGLRLQIPNDSNNFWVPRGCAHEWAAVYYERGFKVREGLYRDDLIWDEFDAFNRAGLMLHESIYLSERRSAAVDSSRRTRQVNAALFSDLKLENVVGGVPRNADLCIFQTPGPKQKATLYWRWFQDTKLRRQFAMIKGHYVLSKKYVEVDESHWKTNTTINTATTSVYEGLDDISISRDTNTEIDTLRIGPYTAYGNFNVIIEETPNFIINSCGSSARNYPIHQKALELLENGNGQL